jgi:hypothetical protein
MDHLADNHPIKRILQPSEQIEHFTELGDALIAVTDSRLAVAEADRVALAVGIEDLRRIQFDIEKKRPATLVIVPERPEDDPQVLKVDPDRYEEVAAILVTVGRRLAAAS